MRKIIYNEDTTLIDEGLFFGRGVFETIHFLKKPILFSYHLERLKEGLIKIGLEPLIEEEKIKEVLYKISTNNIVIKIVVTEKNIIISKRLYPYTEEDYKKGSNLGISKVIKNSTSILTYVKSLNYLENLIEKEKAIKCDLNDIIFLNENKFITETSCANIFIVKDNLISTPKVNDGLLNGIIRRWIIENFKILEKSITLKELLNADEVFITNSLMGIMPVSKIKDKSFLKRKYSDMISKSYEKLKVED